MAGSLGLAFFGACSRTEIYADGEAAIDAAIVKDVAADAPVVLDATPDVQPKACIPGQFDFERATTQLVFVIDRSGSMAFSLDGQDRNPPRGQSRWKILQSSLSPALQSLQGTVELGAKFFPEEFEAADPDAQLKSCSGGTVVDVPPTRNNAQSILSVFDRTNPIGGTPTADAMQGARNYLLGAGRRYLARFLVLATDGAPNCNSDPAITPQNCVCTARDISYCQEPLFDPQQCLDDRRTVDVVRAINDTDKVATFVIGVGADQAQSPAYLATLNAMAIAGGRPRSGTVKYYDGSTVAGLNGAVQSIQNGVARCVFVTPSAPKDPDAISVTIDGTPVARDATNQTGWNWTDQDYGALAFFGPACDTLLANADAKVSGTVACADGGTTNP